MSNKSEILLYKNTEGNIKADIRLEEHIVKGVSLNYDRFKSGNSMNYFNELQKQILDKTFES